MLTADLVRLTRRDGRLYPRYVGKPTEAIQARTQALIDLFQAHVGERRWQLDEALTEHIGVETDFSLQNGLKKLLEDRSEFSQVSPLPPIDLRRKVFEAAASSAPITRQDDPQLGTPRREILARIAQELDTSVEAVEQALFADLKANQVLSSFKPCTPEELLTRYDTALAQGVLLRAHRLTIQLTKPGAKRMRALLRAVKFHGLIHRVGKHPETQALQIELDGPLSLFRLSGKYGVKMANFLPALLLAEDWKLMADVEWERGEELHKFELHSSSKLKSHYADKGTWISDEEKAFRARLKKLGGAWSLKRSARLVRLPGGDLLCPDMVLRHADGREVLVEIVWFWQRNSLEKRLQRVAQAKEPNLMVLVSDRLRTSDKDLTDTPFPVLRFKGVLPVKQILEAADAIAQ